jgi:hypothetical protein
MYSYKCFPTDVFLQMYLNRCIPTNVFLQMCSCGINRIQTAGHRQRNGALWKNWIS